MENREQYVKPVLVQLHYSAEPEVAIAQACKVSGSASGPTVSGCKTTNPFVSCQTIGS